MPFAITRPSPNPSSITTVPGWTVVGTVCHCGWDYPTLPPVTGSTSYTTNCCRTTPGRSGSSYIGEERLDRTRH